MVFERSRHNASTTPRSAASLAMIVALLITLPVMAQDAANYETVLLPVANAQTNGAYGSQWVTQFSVFNESARVIDPNAPAYDIYPLNTICVVSVCVPTLPLIESQRSAMPGLFRPPAPAPPGLLLHVRRDLAAQLHYELRVRDISRMFFNAGTEIPVVRETEFRTGRIQLLDVPVDGNFRHTLRIYDPDRRPTSVVRLRVFPTGPGTALAEQDITLTQQPDGDCKPRDCYPSYGGIQFLTAAFPSLTSAMQVRIELEPITPGLRYWGFVSVVNNETQQVTTITPQ